MMRPLLVVDAGRPAQALAALRGALAEGGPAVLPRIGGARSDADPATVAQSVALVIETSGSTGVPKRVALSADALLASAAASAGALGGQGQWLLALPVHYVAGAQVLVRSLAVETEPVYYGEGRFDAGRFARAAAELDHDFRYTSLVPVQLARLVEAVEGGAWEVAAAVRRFDGILIGGQALDARLRERAEAAGARVLSTYGSSETAGGCVYDGAPIGTTVVRVVDGMLEISGPSLAEGYLGDPARTAAAFSERDGVRWYRTGDLGEVEGGLVTVLGRADSVIISGGEKVLLDAVESVVREVPGYEGAVVVGVADAEWGRVPVVVVEGGALSGAAAGVRGGGVERVSGVEAAVRAVSAGDSDGAAALGAGGPGVARLGGVESGVVGLGSGRSGGVGDAFGDGEGRAASGAGVPVSAPGSDGSDGVDGSDGAGVPDAPGMVRALDGASGELARLRAAVVARLGRAAAPRRIVRVGELPRLGSGKPDRLRIGSLAEEDGRRGTEA